MSPPSDTPASAEYIAFDEFRNGLPHGRFRVVVDPKLAAPFVAYRTHATPLALALIGPGIALALVGHVVTGGLLVASGSTPATQPCPSSCWKRARPTANCSVPRK